MSNKIAISNIKMNVHVIHEDEREDLEEVADKLMLMIFEEEPEDIKRQIRPNALGVTVEIRQEFFEDFMMYVGSGYMDEPFTTFEFYDNRMPTDRLVEALAKAYLKEITNDSDY